MPHGARIATAFTIALLTACGSTGEQPPSPAVSTAVATATVTATITATASATASPSPEPSTQSSAELAAAEALADVSQWIESSRNQTTEGEPRFTKVAFDATTGSVTLTHTNSYARLSKSYGVDDLSSRLQAIMRGVDGVDAAFNDPGIKRIIVVSSDGKPMVDTTPDEFAKVEPGPTDQESDRPTTSDGDDSSGSLAHENAVRMAESYLDSAPFSKKGLIAQLEYEGFSNAEAKRAVASISVDWNEQAADTARSYLDTSAFSRSGLLDQLLFEGFTREQAEHGLTAVGY